MLTDYQVKSLKPKHKCYRLFDGQGLHIEVHPRGTKYWRLKYFYHGKEKRLSFGRYPAVSLKEARQKREDARKLLVGGIDPGQLRKKEKILSSQNHDNTFEAVSREWYDVNKNRWTINYGKLILRRLEADIFPFIGAFPIGEIDPPLLLQTIRKIEERGALEVAKRQLQKCGQIFSYAIATGRIKYDPSCHLKEALAPRRSGHYACFEINEIPTFIKRLGRSNVGLHATTLNATRMMMLTFVRTSELIHAEWSEIDVNKALWVVPGKRMKMRNPHIVPLARQTLEIIEAQRRITGRWQYVFAGMASPRVPMSNNTILSALSALGYKGQMTGHGFRALAMSTIKQELGYRHEVVDRQLAHAAKNTNDAAYDRAMFLNERIKMMQDWADYLDRVSGKIQDTEAEAKTVITIPNDQNYHWLGNPVNYQASFAGIVQ